MLSVDHRDFFFFLLFGHKEEFCLISDMLERCLSVKGAFWQLMAFLVECPDAIHFVLFRYKNKKWVFRSCIRHLRFITYEVNDSVLEASSGQTALFFAHLGFIDFKSCLIF